MGMDKVIEKKKGIRPKHIIWAAGVLIIGFLLYKVVFADGDRLEHSRNAA